MVTHLKWGSVERTLRKRNPTAPQFLTKKGNNSVVFFIPLNVPYFTFIYYFCSSHWKLIVSFYNKHHPMPLLIHYKCRNFNFTNISGQRLQYGFRD